MNEPPKIMCAASVLNGNAAFSTVGDTVILPEESITREDLRDVDVLITRSKAKINRDLLEGTPVRFVGCAVAGTDHVDEAFLEEAGIAWCHAPGCNANSVAEQMITTLLIEAERYSLACDEIMLGIIGVGHIGRRVQEKAMAVGISTLVNDPPREAAEGMDAGPFVVLDDLLEACNVVTLHVPYTRSGPHATGQMLNHRFVETLSPGSLLFNAARGEIMDSEAVLMGLEHGILRQAALDVWENEPRIRKDLLDAVEIGTPHIAGYSYEGRLNGTQMVYDELCHFLEVEPVWSSDELATEGALPEQVIDGRGRSDQETLTALVSAASPLLDDDRRFREGASADQDVMGRHFVHCRRNYPTRREFAATRFLLRNVSPTVADTAWKLGFQLSD